MTPTRSKKNALVTQFSSVRSGDFGIFGDPIEHSLSPVMQNAALKAWWEGKSKPNQSTPLYHALHVKPEQLEEALQLAQEQGIRGLNITVPHKEMVFQKISSLDPSAEERGAVNTLGLNEGKWKGYNTDGFGFETSLREDLDFDPRGRSAFVLGAGGTGRVMIHQLLLMGAQRVFLWNRNEERAQELQQVFNTHHQVSLALTENDIDVALKASDLVVNATSAGLQENDGLPFKDLKFSSSQVYFDVIYHRETVFIKEAKKVGAKTTNGLGMLLYQGARSFEIWTQSTAPVELMKKSLLEEIKKRTR